MNVSMGGPTIHVEECMGTVFTISIADSSGTWIDAIVDVMSWLHDVDRIFSTYRSDSDVSRIRRGELDLVQAHPLVRQVVDLCQQAEQETEGAFSANLPTGFDPSGLVKGWAIERASEILSWHGSQNHAVNGGGDIQLRGESAPGEPWRVGIVDPDDRTNVLRVISGRDFAIATSGLAERGAHIFEPKSGHVPNRWTSTTVVGPSLTRADTYATACFVMGEHAQTWKPRPGYSVLLVDQIGATWSDGVGPALAAGPFLAPCANVATSSVWLDRVAQPSVQNFDLCPQ